MVNLPAPDSDSQSPALLDLFFSSDANICSTIAFPPLGNSDPVIVLVSIGLPLQCMTYDCSHADWGSLDDHNNCCKRVRQAAKLAHANKTRVYHFQDNELSRFFDLVFLTKVNLPYLLYSMAPRCCFLHLIKQSCLLKTVLRTLILMTQVSLYLFSLLELIWNCIVFL